jgi:hypothetical protein
VFLFEIVFCAESQGDIIFQNADQDYRIGYIDKNTWKPFNKKNPEIQLRKSEVAEMAKSGSDVRLINDTAVIFFSYKKEFSGIAKAFEDTNLDDNHKKYVSQILNGAENFQAAVAKHTKMQLGEFIMPVLSDFITEVCEPKIFNEKDRKNLGVRTSVNVFLKKFDQACERCYFKASEQVKGHFYTNVGLGVVLLMLYLRYRHRKYKHFALYLERLMPIVAYIGWLTYDYKDRIILWMVYRKYKKYYADLTDPYANDSYLYDKFND